MNTQDYEVFYYKDNKIDTIKPHKHNYYEFYFFLEGIVKYAVDDKYCNLKYGDFLLIPPNIVHNPYFIDKNHTYRRFVLWIHKDLMNKFSYFTDDIKFGMDFATKNKNYFYHLEYIQFNDLFGCLLDLWQEHNENNIFKKSIIINNILTIILKINRIIYEKNYYVSSLPQKKLFNLIFNYINSNITEDLTLEKIANNFYVSKYYVSHIFKENLGISLHKYIIKKRLNICRGAIATGEPITSVAEKLGFVDYASFYRAFKKEYGISPKDYKKNINFK